MQEEKENLDTQPVSEESPQISKSPLERQIESKGDEQIEYHFVDNKGDADYGADKLEHLSDLEHVRERPSMYIADTTTRGAAPSGVRGGGQLD